MSAPQVFSPYHESWRKHPEMSQGANFRRTLPGFGVAVAIFGTYLALDFFYKRFGPKPFRNVCAEEFEGTRYEGAFEMKEKSNDDD